MTKKKKSYSHRLTRLYVVIGVAVVSVVGALIVQANALKEIMAAGETVQLSLTPATVSVPGTATAKIMLDAKTNKVATVRAVVNFDRTKVRLASEVALGSRLSTAVLVTPMSEANTTGKLIVVAVLSTADRSNPPSGLFEVATLQWAAVGTTRATVQATFDTEDSRVADLTPVYLPIAASAQTILVNGGSVSPTPMPTVRPTAVPTARPTATPTSRPISPTVRPSGTVTPTRVPTIAPTSVPPTSKPSPTSSPNDPNSTTRSLTFKATEDTTVYRNYPNSTGAKGPAIRVDGSPIHNLLVKFRVSGVGNNRVVRAKLRLYNTQMSLGGGKFYATTSLWREAEVNWRTAPAAFDYLGSLGLVRAGRWYEVDVTKFVKGDGTYSIRGMSTISDGADYSSSEGSHPPELVVTFTN